MDRYSAREFAPVWAPFRNGVSATYFGMSRLGDLVAAAARVVTVAPRRQSSETDDQQFYRFWHLEYGETAYYDQLVFRRHRDVAPPGALAMDIAESIPSRASRERVEEPVIPEQRSQPLTPNRRRNTRARARVRAASPGGHPGWYRQRASSRRLTLC